MNVPSYALMQNAWNRQADELGPRRIISSNSVKRVHKCSMAQQKFYCHYLN